MRFLLVDRILELSSGHSIRGVKHVTRDDYYLGRDDQGRVCYIPSLLGETLGQLAAWNVMVSNDFTLRPVAGIVASAQLLRPAYVGETVFLESVIDSLDEAAVRYHSVATVDGEEIFRIENALGPLLPMNDFIDESTVRRQFAEIYRPGSLNQAMQPAAAADELGHLIEPAVQLQFDRILNFNPAKSLVAQKLVSRAAPYFPDHFPYKPVLPMTVLLECKLNLARFFLKRSNFSADYTVREMRKIKMNEFVHPGDVLTCHLSVKHQDASELILNYRSEVDGKRVCVVDVVMAAKEIV